MTLPQDTSRLQSRMSAAVHEHWMAFLLEGILLVVLGLAAMIVPPLASFGRHHLSRLDVSHQRVSQALR